MSMKCHNCGKIIVLSLEQQTALTGMRIAQAKLRVLNIKTITFNTLQAIDSTAKCCDNPDYFYIRN